MRKSAVVTVMLATTTAAYVAACQPAPRPVEDKLYTDIATCVADGKTQSTCEADFAAAKAATPSFADKAQCEAQFGAGNCESKSSNTGGGGSSFAPMMMGFMAGQMLANNANSSALRSSGSPAFMGANGSVVDSTGRNTGFSAVKNANGTFGVKNTSTTRGGFGASASGRSSAS